MSRDLKNSTSVRPAAARSRSHRLLVLAALTAACGCATDGGQCVPVSRVPELVRRFDVESQKVPVDLALLRQEPPKAYTLGPRDVVSVYVFGVIPPDPNDSPVVQPPLNVGSEYYPPYGALRVPSFGLPFEIDSDGSLTLPLAGPIPVAGLTVEQARKAIRDAYEKTDVLKGDRNRITLSVVRPRGRRIMVLREDQLTTNFPSTLTGAAVPFTKRGSGEVIELPDFECDVLHALTTTGGLPGIDAANEVWVFRGVRDGEAAVQRLVDDPDNYDDFQSVQKCLGGGSFVRIPLRVLPGHQPDLSPEDVILEEGDVVFVPARREFFYTGGLLEGRQVPLPRDREIDVVDAIALAGGSLFGPSGAPGAFTFAGRGFGNIIPPTRATVRRQLPDGRHILLRVDLKRAMHDQREQLIVQPEDLVMLEYKPHEVVGSSILNIFTGVGTTFSFIDTLGD